MADRSADAESWCLLWPDAHEKPQERGTCTEPGVLV